MQLRAAAVASCSCSAQSGWHWKACQGVEHHTRHLLEHCAAHVAAALMVMVERRTRPLPLHCVAVQADAVTAMVDHPTYLPERCGATRAAAVMARVDLHTNAAVLATLDPHTRNLSEHFAATGAVLVMVMVLVNFSEPGWPLVTRASTQSQ